MSLKVGFGSFVDAFSVRTLSVASVIQASLIGFVGILLIYKVLIVRKPRLKLPPGPPRVPLFGNWLQFRDGINPKNLAAVAREYGDLCLLRMGQRDVLVVSSPEMAKEVLQIQGVEFGSRARNLVFDMTTGKGSDMVFADYGDHWRKMRRIATLPFFTSKVVQQCRGAWQEEIDLAIREIAAAEGATTTGNVIRNRLQLMMYNIVYKMMFDMRFESERDPLYVKLMNLNMENVILGQSFKYNYGDFVPSFRPFLRGYLKAVYDANQRRLAFLRDAFLNERKRKRSEEKIGVDFFLDAESKGEITENNVLYLTQNMNVAAIETTLWSSEWSVAELVNHPEIQSKLFEELNEVLGDNPVTEPELPKLPYLQAFVKEILRTHMVIPMLLPHMNTHTAKLGGYDIPAGCRVLVNAWGIANDPRYWLRPEEFRPDRFLEESKLEPMGNDFRFIPFGSGRRSCPGSVIALPVLSLVVGRLVQAFELLPPPGSDSVDLKGIGGQLSLTLAKHSRVVVKPRKK
eukprot:c28082_g1_i1 orf=324-1868(+)